MNVGCVPKKVMFNAAFMKETMHLAAANGFTGTEDVKLRYEVLRDKRNAYVKRLNGIYERNLERDNITQIQGAAKFVNKNTVEVNGQQYSADHIVITTGGYPSVPQDTPGSEYGITSDGFFDDMQELPKKVAVVGAGYIAVELAGILNALGSETHLIIRRDKFLRTFDSQTVAVIREEMEKTGIIIHENTTTGKVEKAEDGTLTLTCKNGKEIGSSFNTLVWAIGRRPNTDIGLEAAGVELTPQGRIKADEFQNTTTPGIYALGDVTGPLDLTPVAIAAGRKLAERLFNGQTDLKQDYSLVPTVIFTHPPIGTCGMSEEQAREEYKDVQVHTSRFNNMFFTMLQPEEKPPTFMKMITAGPEEKVVGLHLAGHGCDEMMQGFAVAMKMGATRKQFNDCIPIHPTGAEEVVLL